jgi:hypothetical protein
VEYAFYETNVDIMIKYILTTEHIYQLITEHLNIKRFIELPASFFTAYCNYPKILILFFIPRFIIA